MTKAQIKQKKQRRAERISDKQTHEAATIAIRYGCVMAMQAVRDVWKERATNPKLEAFVIRYLSFWEALADKRVNINTMRECLEMETGINYDFNSGNIYNMRKKG